MKTAARVPRNAALAPTSTRHRLFLSCSVIGPLLFIGAFLIEQATGPDYDSLRQAVCALSLGGGGWIQDVNFIAFGLFLSGLAVTLLPEFTPRGGRHLGRLTFRSGRIRAHLDRTISPGSSARVSARVQSCGPLRPSTG